MCGRFYVEDEDTPEELRLMMEEANRRPLAQQTPVRRGEVTPGSTACVKAPARGSGRLQAYPMRWGYPMNGKLLINARLETAGERPTFRDSFLRRRCLIPASAWFEWDHAAKPMRKYRFSARETRWLYLAGLYRTAEDGSLQFTVVTREPTDVLRRFHDRMPLAFLPDAAGMWLGGETSVLSLCGEALGEIVWSAEEAGGNETQKPAQLSFLEE